MLRLLTGINIHIIVWINTIRSCRDLLFHQWAQNSNSCSSM